MALKKSKKLWLIPLVPVTLYVIASFAIQPLVNRETHKILRVFDGYNSTYRRAWFSPLTFTWQVTDVKIVKESAGGTGEPLFSSEAVEIAIDWRELRNRNLVARVAFQRPSVHLIASDTRPGEQLDPRISNLSQKLGALLPLKVQRITASRAQLSFIDTTRPEFPRVLLNDLDATLENLARSNGEPTMLAVAGLAQQIAQFSAFVTMDPVAPGLSFSGSFRVEGLALVDLKNLVSSPAGLQFDQGMLDVAAEFDCSNGLVTTSVKPELKNAHAVKGKVLPNLVKEVFADADATQIPLNGRITNPDVQVVTAVGAVIRNAFALGVSEAFAHAPPHETAKAPPEARR